MDTVTSYLHGRVVGLIPRREKTVDRNTLLKAIVGLTWLQWGHFWVGWLAWTCDAFDFFSVSLSVTNLGKTFDRDTTTITTAITLTLLFRSAGAVIFGILSDRYGRKWPLVINLLIAAAFELGSGFCTTFRQFLAVRSFFGVAMGGIWGLAVSTALENLPVEVRGAASGFLQEGYAVGYLIAAVVNLTLVPETTTGWRGLFWLGAGISVLAAFLRMLMPESEYFLRAHADQVASGQTTSKKTRIFMKTTWQMLKRHWLLCIYAIVLMSGFNFLSHGSQDLYPTYLTHTKGFSQHDATVATIIGNCGAIVGGTLAGWASQYVGGESSIFCCVIGAFIPLWIIPNSFGALAAGAFFVQVGVQGAWGVIPIQLSEMSPPAFRATFPGVAYQIGNMVSSASAQIESTGKSYATVQGILVGVVAAFVVVWIFLGPENHGSRFEKYKAAFEEGAGNDEEMQHDPDAPRAAADATAEYSRPTSVQINEEKRSSEGSV